MVKMTKNSTTSDRCWSGWVQKKKKKKKHIKIKRKRVIGWVEKDSHLSLQTFLFLFTSKERNQFGSFPLSANIDVSTFVLSVYFHLIIHVCCGANDPIQQFHSQTMQLTRYKWISILVKCADVRIKSGAERKMNGKAQSVQARAR